MCGRALSLHHQMGGCLDTTYTVWAEMDKYMYSFSFLLLRPSEVFLSANITTLDPHCHD